MAKIIDEFIIMSGKRKVSLQRRTHSHKPYVVVVYFRKVGLNVTWTLLSTTEYADGDLARHDFEIRRPKPRVETEEVPMQRGKRLVQEVMDEKLGARKS